MPAEKQTKDQRREAAREAARIQREAQKRREARKRIFVRGGVTLGILAALGVIVLIIVVAVQPPGPGPRNMLSDGALLTSEDGEVIKVVRTEGIPSEGEPVATDPTALDAPVHMVLYIDYFCPFCKQFEDTNAAQIKNWVLDGTVALEIHPISILDKSSLGTRYSSRAANAMACVADLYPGSFFDANTELFNSQPAEGTEGLTNAQIISLIAEAGVLAEDLSACIKDETFKAWVTAATQRALTGPLPNSDASSVEGTPTVIVNGVKYTGPLDSALTFRSFVQDQIPAS